jgi:hypothetical protein
VKKVVEVTNNIVCEVEGSEVGESMEEAREERVCSIKDSKKESDTVGDREKPF